MKVQDLEQEFIEIDGEKIDFLLKRKNIKNIHLRVTSDGNVTISIPKKMRTERAKEFLRSKISWVKKQQKSFKSFASPKESKSFENGDILYILGKPYKIELLKDNKNNIIIENDYIKFYIKKQYFDNKFYISKLYEKWLKQYAFNVIKDFVAQYQNKLKNYGINLPEIEIKKRKSVWGSCFPTKNKVIFNLSLIKTPVSCIEYVVLHELSHFKYPNHSKDFHNFITAFMPDWKTRKKALNKEWGPTLD